MYCRFCFGEEGIAALVGMGRGVSVVAHVESLDHSAGIVLLPIDMPDCRRILSIGYLKDGYLPPAAQDFIGFLTRRCIPVSGLTAIRSEADD